MVKSTLIVMATGTGKTVVMGEVARRWPREQRIMVLAHREELIQQAAKKIGAICSEECAIEMADFATNENVPRSYKNRIVIGSVATLRGKRLEKFDPHEFGLVMTDEAHHATANSYRTIYNWFGKNSDLRHLGVTATPDRADEEALGKVFDSVAFEYGILDGINDGFLVPIEQQFVHVEGLDLSDCKSDKSDLVGSDVARVMEVEANLHKVVSPVLDLSGDAPTLVFAASVEHAHRMAEIFNRHRQGCAVAIDGTTDKESRKRDLVRFSRGEFQYLCNVGVFTEGFDEPRVGCVAMARPTKSRALYAQVAGRGTRPLPGLVDGLDTADERRNAILTSGKPSMLMLDFVGNSGRHKLCSTADILGGNESDEVVDRATLNAKRKSAMGKKTDMRQELIEAREQIEDELKARHHADLALQSKRAHVRAAAKFSTQAVNPFDIFDIVPRREPGWHKGRRPTAGQVKTLEKFKVDQKTIDGLSFCQASQMLDVLCQRAKQGLCSVKQAKILAKYGLPTDVTFVSASQTIDALARNNWKPLTKEMV